MNTAGLVALSLFGGFLVATVTTPVGVSGAVLLLPIQFSVIGVPSPAVTPTNLLFNVVSIPGALFRYSRRASLHSPLTAVLLLGTRRDRRCICTDLPSPRRTNVSNRCQPRAIAPGPVVVLSVRKSKAVAQPSEPLSTRRIAALALGVGVVGGVDGIGGGSLISPVLVRRGMPVAVVAPAALLSTWVTSVVGAITYAVIAFWMTDQHIGPRWDVGLLCGVGGLLGGFLGAHLQPMVSERILRLVLGGLAISTAVVYLLGG